MTSDRARSSALRWAGAVIIGLAGGVGAAFAVAELLAGTSAGGLEGAAHGAALAVFEQTLRTSPLAAGAILGAPLAAALLAALLVCSGGRSATPAQRARAETAGAAGTSVRAGAATAVGRARPSTPSEAKRPTQHESDAALRLLALLQQQGRLVDFLEEDLAAYPDDQIGAAVRAIHQGCRAVLRERLDLAPILPGGEGSTVTVERGFDPGAVRVTGNVRGEPPYQGILRHPGWRSMGLRLPEAGGRDASVLAPAEVEVL